MLSAIKKHDKQKIFAWDEEKSPANIYLCPVCESVVILKKGSVKAPHFAHKPPVTCEYGAAESEMHYECKTEIYQQLCLLPDVTKCEMERNLQTVRPDISFYYEKTPIAIEVQISNLPLATIIKRTTEYTQKGIYLLWLMPFKYGYFTEKYVPKLWEKWIHTTYFGNVYFWRGGLQIIPVQFKPFYIEVELTDFGGGYSKLSKRFKTPFVKPPIILPEDFEPIDRGSFETKHFSIPKAKLLVGKKGKV